MSVAVLTIYGLVLAWKESKILTLILLIVTPVALVSGMLMLVCKINIPQQIQSQAHLPW